MTVRIILADDHKIIRDGLNGLLSRETDIEVIAQCSDGHDAVELVRKLLPQVVIMDIGMPGLNGIEATRQITNEFPGVRVISFSMHSDKKFVTEMLRAGASGYLLKDCAFEELTTAIRTVVAGKTYLSPVIADVVVENYVRNPSTEGKTAFSVLTNREREILQLLVESKTTKQVSRILHISTKTVETHRSNIMKKLNIDNMVALTKYAVREGLTTLDV